VSQNQKRNICFEASRDNKTFARKRFSFFPATPVSER